MIVFPLCKINLGLNVVSKRPDGYHEIETCFYPVPLTDVLEVIPASAFSFTQTGILLDGQSADNLCVKAFELLSRDYVIPPVSMHLHKVIPAGAGLGGGSSDAVHVLRLLNTYFELGISRQTLQRYASRLGSDCAFFLYDGPMLGKGKGDILSPISINLKGYSLILVKPRVYVSTAEAYRCVVPKQPVELIETVLKSDIRQWNNRLVNDFEASVFSKHPEIGVIKAVLYNHGALYAGMSGSGSSVYGIFEQPIDLSHEFSDYFYWAGLLP
ncbi:4-(cytidine 5'-diphospho)-2-C-methyl-D-erythritol kinase [Oscillatoria amoena NRMC-F 0135]|nr:4-(cytidine 5'-diphospho)-2-C-methyl-D-erythritol kinase [Oscillatoria amoena NRMC-F 0135]